MSNLVMQCPSCSQPFQVAPETAGQTVACPSCTSPVTIPPTPEPETSPAGTSEPTVRHCPECAGPFAVTPEMAGKRIACPHCDREVTVEIDQTAGDAPESTTLDNNRENDLFAPGFTPDDNTVSDEKSSGLKNDPGTQLPSTDKKTKSKRFKGNSHSPISGLPPTSDQTHAPIPEDTAANGAEGHYAQSSLPTLHKDEEDTEKTTPSADDENTQLALETLPTPFLVDDPQQMSVLVQRDDTKILLPDADEGTRQLDRRLVRIEYKGQTVELVSRTPTEQKHYRMIVNAISMLLGLLFIAIAFLILLW